MNVKANLYLSKNFKNKTKLLYLCHLLMNQMCLEELFLMEKFLKKNSFKKNHTFK